MSRRDLSNIETRPSKAFGEINVSFEETDGDVNSETETCTPNPDRVSIWCSQQRQLKSLSLPQQGLKVTPYKGKSLLHEYTHGKAWDSSFSPVFSVSPIYGIATCGLQLWFIYICPSLWCKPQSGSSSPSSLTSSLARASLRVPQYCRPAPQPHVPPPTQQADPLECKQTTITPFPERFWSFLNPNPLQTQHKILNVPQGQENNASQPLPPLLHHQRLPYPNSQNLWIFLCFSWQRGLRLHTELRLLISWL